MGQDGPSILRRSAYCFDIEVAAADTPQGTDRLRQDDILTADASNLETAIANNMELGPGKNGLGTYRAIFLADNTWDIHGPGQTAAMVDKSRSDAQRPALGKGASAHSLIDAQRSQRCGRAHMAAGHTILLAAAGADTKVQHWRPKAFCTGLPSGGMDYIGRANPHALPTFDAAGQ
jgi:hypothetical protein